MFDPARLVDKLKEQYHRMIINNKMIQLNYSELRTSGVALVSERAPQHAASYAADFMAQRTSINISSA